MYSPYPVHTNSQTTNILTYKCKLAYPGCFFLLMCSSKLQLFMTIAQLTGPAHELRYAEPHLKVALRLLQEGAALWEDPAEGL